VPIVRKTNPGTGQLSTKFWPLRNYPAHQALIKHKSSQYFEKIQVSQMTRLMI
jgi:hypothetical protein